MKRLIIGFGHKRRSGKDTCGEFAAEYLIKHRNIPFTQIDWFARSLKAACIAAFDFNEDQMWGPSKLVVDPYWGFTPAFALQKTGTEAMRHTFGDDFWVKTLKRRVLASRDTCFVITDVRFPNEAAAIKSWGGFVVDVVRPQAPEALADGRDSDHPSETALDLYADWDGVIINDGTIEQLRDQVTKLVDRFLHVLAMREREEVS